MDCPNCGSGEKIKNGIVHSEQRYRCKSCGFTYTKGYKRGHPLKDKVLAVIMHLSGMSMNSIAPIIGVSTQSIMRWIYSFSETVAKPEIEGDFVEVELDEMHHFLLKKLKNYGSGRCLITEIPNSWGGFVGIVLPKPERK